MRYLCVDQKVRDSDKKQFKLLMLTVVVSALTTASVEMVTFKITARDRSRLSPWIRSIQTTRDANDKWITDLRRKKNRASCFALHCVAVK